MGVTPLKPSKKDLRRMISQVFFDRQDHRQAFTKAVNMAVE